MGGPMPKLAKIFRSLPDPRAPNAVHELLDILVIALAAVLCGAKCATDMELFGRAKEKLLRQFLRLEHGIPSHDTFSRVFRALDPEAFERIFRQFMVAFAKANGIKLTGVVAVDGKAVRGAYERSKSSTPLHMVNVFAADARMVLATRKAPGRNRGHDAGAARRRLGRHAGDLGGVESRDKPRSAGILRFCSREGVAPSFPPPFRARDREGGAGQF